MQEVEGGEDSRMVRAIPLTGGLIHIARSGATVVPRSRVRALGFNARSALPHASSRKEQPPFLE